MAARRLAILAEARARGPGFLRLDPLGLPFHLGTSLADLRVPVHVTEEATAVVRAAAVQVALLLGSHHRRLVPSADMDRLYLREEYASLPATEDALSPQRGGPDLLGAARLALLSHPALHGGLLTAWMGPGGKGRSLTALWIAVLRGAFADGPPGSAARETPLVVVMALQGALRDTAAGLREVLPGAPHDRWVRAASLTALWVAARTGLARACRDAGIPSQDPLRLRLEALLNPGTLLGGRGAFLGGGSTLYGPELLAGVPRGEEIATRLAEGGDPDAAVGDIEAALASDDDVSRRAEGAVAVERLREALSNAIVAVEASGQGAAAADLRGPLVLPGGLAALVADEEGRRQLAARAQQALSRFLAGEGAAALDVAVRGLRGWRPREPGAAMGLSRAEARARYAVAAAALLADAALERISASARRVLVMRTGAEAEGGATAEWEAGRLYRVAARTGPILAAGRERLLAHLFADVKDFTRRTGLLGPAAMAEFLRREFYLPILAAAKARFTGMGHLSDRGGVAVNNILGDAISLSGDIEALVSLAAEIRRLLATYEARLAHEVTGEVVAGRVGALQQRFAREIASARLAADQARAVAERAPPGSPERADALRQAALHAASGARLASERERAVARTRGEGLEAGVFVSFGPAPLVITIDDEAFGKNRVAIAEKINESARGTARAPAARSRADRLLEAERAARGLPDLRHAWSVFIGQPLTLTLPPAAEAAALGAARAGDLAAAMRAVARPVREALEAASRAVDEGSGDVYNAGAALSEEALLAFLEAIARTRTVRRVELDVRVIPDALADRWWFGSGTESLVVTFHADGRPAEMFRRVGRAWFKGLGEVPVWEIAADTGGPAALFQAMRESWWEGAGGSL